MTAPPAFFIRPARGADLLRLAEIEAASFADAWPVDLLAVELVHPQAILLITSRQREPPAGYAVFRHFSGEAELLRLGVAPEERRQGLGRSLVEAGFNWLRAEAVEVCHLEVRVDNHSAIALYEDLGFERTGQRRGYYRDGMDALIYTKSL
jgi:ribosomal-protein-alanine N-acetyltransferase